MSEQIERPLSRWVLLALSPMLGYDALAALGFLHEDLAAFGVIVGLAVPLVALVMLILLANSYYSARGDGSFRSRALFVLGFGVVNAVLWLGGCAMTANTVLKHGIH